jgi:hypothetical protein
MKTLELFNKIGLYKGTFPWQNATVYFVYDERKSIKYAHSNTVELALSNYIERSIGLNSLEIYKNVSFIKKI